MLKLERVKEIIIPIVLRERFKMDKDEKNLSISTVTERKLKRKKDERYS